MQCCTVRFHGTKRLHVWEANNFFLRLRGLLGRSLAQGQAMHIVPCHQVHCCGMKMPIDVLYLDRQHTIVKITQNMQPGTFGKSVKGAYSVLELCEGEADRLQLLVGDIIQFER